jgi:Protein of unknown function with HXXEE motif
MSIVTVGWLFTLGVLAHNAEEALYLPAWEALYLPPGWMVRVKRWNSAGGAKEFRFAVAILSAALVGITTVTSVTGAGSLAAYLLAGYALSMIINGLVPHTIATVAMRRYMPGTATAVLLNLPLGCLLLIRALSENYIQLKVFVWSGPLFALLMLASLPILFAVGKRLRT